MRVHPEWKLNREAASPSVPATILDAVENYVLYGHHVGHFLTAVMTNDLKESCARAGDDVRYCLFDIVDLLYNHIPTLAWGSPEKVETWQRHQGLEGLIQAKMNKAAETAGGEEDDQEEGI